MQSPQQLDYGQNENSMVPLGPMNFQSEAQNFQNQTYQMPLPSVPWTINEMPWRIGSQGNNVMHFSAAQNAKLLHQKRKSDIFEAIPPKQFISEERITAHFTGLHISSNCIESTNVANVNNDLQQPKTMGKCFTNLTYNDYKNTAKELEQKLMNATRITLCDELEKLNEEQRKSSIIPEPLLVGRFENPPCTAVMLWQPPPPTIELLRKVNKETSEQDNNSQENLNEAEMDDGDDDNDSSRILADNGFPTGDVEFENNNTYSVDFNKIISEDCMEEDF